ncbi:dicarboxylate/amino acid:cation symporter, partial [Salmonella enterica subsp. enterica serovar Enteritidis]|nr:dicarboxylate/amino acid:cation symporter [Salmonella enterica subsp. enterica serovar Enteritidis]
GIDHFLDMGRSAINVLGNGIATAMLAQNEGLLEESDVEAVSQQVGA